MMTQGATCRVQGAACAVQGAPCKAQSDTQLCIVRRAMCTVRRRAIARCTSTLHVARCTLHEHAARCTGTLHLARCTLHDALFRALGVCLSMMIVMMMSSCTRPAEGDRVAVFTKNQTNPFFRTVRLGADNAAKQMNASITHYIPTQPDSIPEQMSQIEDVITKRPSAVVFVPVDSKAMVPGLQKMNAAGIPVVNIVDHSLGGEVLSWVGADEYGLALLAGRYLLQKMNGQGSVIIIEGVGGSLGSAERVRGFRKALEEF